MLLWRLLWKIDAPAALSIGMVFLLPMANKQFHPCQHFLCMGHVIWSSWSLLWDLQGCGCQPDLLIRRDLCLHVARPSFCSGSCSSSCSCFVEFDFESQLFQVWSCLGSGWCWFAVPSGFLAKQETAFPASLSWIKKHESSASMGTVMEFLQVVLWFQVLLSSPVCGLDVCLAHVVNAVVVHDLPNSWAT